MTDALVMFHKIAGVFVILGVGWLAKRRGVLTDDAMRSCSRFTIDVALPCLIYVKILATVTREELLRFWILPVVGAGLVLLAEWTSRLALGRNVDPASRDTAVLVAGCPNWLYLALAVLQPVLGDVATRTLLLTNVGIHAYLWTLGIAPFCRGTGIAATLRRVLATPALLATAAGVATLWWFPQAPLWIGLKPEALAAAHWKMAAFSTLVDAMDMLGAVAIPLNLALVGAQLVNMPALARGGKRLLARVVFLRLVLAPGLGALALAVGIKAGWDLPGPVFLTLALMAAMPSAVVCSLITEVHGGDTPLAARGIFATTALSLATIPLWALVLPHLHLWAVG